MQVRFAIYKKGLESIIDIKSPLELGGLKSPEYLALNPQGKMPVLVLPDGTSLPESEVRPPADIDLLEPRAAQCHAGQLACSRNF